MNASQKFFLLAVEEMNFTKAAARAFVSQQCISEHIHRLEEQYRVTLFERRPALRLTPAGKLMYKTLSQIKLLENDLDSQLEMVSTGMQGHLAMGVNDSRLVQMLPRLFPTYHKAFPEVSISFFPGDTVNLQQSLEKGELDLILGIDAEYDSQFEYTNLTYDQLFFVVSERLLEEYAPQLVCQIDSYIRDGFPLENIRSIPLILNNCSSTNYQTVISGLNAAQIIPNCILQTSNFDTQFELCRDGKVGAFLPSIMIPRILSYNRSITDQPDRQLLIFSIREISKALRIDCIYLRKPQYPSYLTALIEQLKQISQDYQREVRSYFGTGANGTAASNDTI